MSQYNADTIVVLEGLEAVRKRPGMYIGSTDYHGLHHLIYEIVDNAVDEYLAGYCSRIQVRLEEDGSVSVTDNGRGIPVDMHKKGVCAERLIFTTLHAGGKFDNQNYKVSGGLHGVGSSVVNALSAWMKVEIYRDGSVYKDSYAYGQPDTVLVDGLLPAQGKTKQTGTNICFLPDASIFDTMHFRSDVIGKHLHEMAYLNPGLTIEFMDARVEPAITEIYCEPQGIVTYIQALNEGKEVVTPIIQIEGEEDKSTVCIALQFTERFEETILGYCNGIHTTEGGTHLTGFKTKFTSLINNYARELGILKEKEPNFSGADTRCGMTAIVSVKHPDPLFEGQTKTKLGSQEISKAVATVTGNELVKFFDKNLEVIKAVIERAKISAKVHSAEAKVKSNFLTKQKLSLDSNGKLANCEGRNRKKNEIFIVEGDSAGGSAKMARNRSFQAILPIRGKILNVEKASIDKVLANAEIKTMILALGCGFSQGYGFDFDIAKLKYDKIIIMTDADIDGAHISTLLLTFFFRFMPELIEKGHIYLAMPPLYQAIPKRGTPQYLYDDLELAAYRKSHKDFHLQRYKGLGEMDAQQLWETTLNPETRRLQQISIDDYDMAGEVTQLLMGTDVLPRKNFIYEYAREAQLDI